MSWEEISSRGAAAPPDALLVGCKKSGQNWQISLDFGPQLAQQLGVEIDKRVQIYRGYDGDLGLVKLRTRDTKLGHKIRKHPSRRGHSLISFSASRWGVKKSFREQVCSADLDPKGDVIVKLPRWARVSS